MDLRETQTLRASGWAGARHPWEIARLQFFQAVLRDAGRLSGTQRLLDAGAGDAWFASALCADLPPEAEVVGWDSEYDPGKPPLGLPLRLELTRDRPQGAFDLVLLLDVLEHVQDDRAFLAELVRENVEAGGWLLFSVPAWQGLYTQHDAWLQHHRRYAPAEARAVLRAAGLEVVRSGGLFHSLLLPRAVTRVAEFVAPPDARRPHAPAIAWPHGRWLTAAVQAALAVDNQASAWLAAAGRDVPGLTWWALCRRPYSG